MRVKTSELIGVALDWAVAKACGYTIFDLDLLYDVKSYDKFNPSTNWGHGGPVIEQECIAVFSIEHPRPFHGAWAAVQYSQQQASEINDMGGIGFSFYEESVIIGDTPLIAAMRCYVVSKLGEEVEVPEDLSDSSGVSGETE